MNSEVIENKYLSDIYNFKNTVTSFVQIEVIPKYESIASAYFHTIIGYLINLCELSNQFAKLNNEKLFIASTIISRSIFEECAIINQLIKEKKYGNKAYFYKYLYIQDMYQDIMINKGWDNTAEEYWRRIHNLLLKQFPSKIKSAHIQSLSNNIDSFNSYSISEKTELINIVEQLKGSRIYKKYTKSKICSVLFEEVYSNTNFVQLDVNQEAKQDARIIYNQLCHYSHLNLTAIDNFNIIKNFKFFHKIFWNIFIFELVKNKHKINIYIFQTFHYI